MREREGARETESFASLFEYLIVVRGEGLVCVWDADAIFIPSWLQKMTLLISDRVNELLIVKAVSGGRSEFLSSVLITVCSVFLRRECV